MDREEADTPPALCCGRRSEPDLLPAEAPADRLPRAGCLLASNCFLSWWKAAPCCAAAAFRAPAPVGAALLVCDTVLLAPAAPLPLFPESLEPRAPARGSDAPALLVDPPVLPSLAASVRRLRREDAEDLEPRLPPLLLALLPRADAPCTGRLEEEAPAALCAADPFPASRAALPLTFSLLWFCLLLLSLSQPPMTASCRRALSFCDCSAACFLRRVSSFSFRLAAAACCLDSVLLSEEPRPLPRLVLRLRALVRLLLRSTTLTLNTLREGLPTVGAVVLRSNCMAVRLPLRLPPALRGVAPVADPRPPPAPPSPPPPDSSAAIRCSKSTSWLRLCSMLPVEA